MNQKQPQERAKDSLEIVRAWLAEQNWGPISILYTLLDAHLLLGESGLLADDLQPLFEVWWPDASLAQSLTGLLGAELLTVGPGSSYAVPEGLRRPLAAEMERYLARASIHLPDGSTEFEALLDDFIRHNQGEWEGVAPTKRVAEVWGGRALVSGGQWHLLLRRPFPLRLHAHPEAYILMICELPEIGLETITEQFVGKPALRHRLAMLDLAQGHKINLTRSGVFVYFERYLRQVHGLRIMHAPALTQSLVDSGLLVLEKG